MSAVLAVFALLIGLLSWLFVPQATLGVAGIGFARLLAIPGRSGPP